MRYFKYEMWSGINSEFEKIRDESYSEWNKNSKAYSEVFKLAQDKLSKTFLKNYLLNHGFHDFHVQSITINNNEEVGKNGISIDICVRDRVSRWKITYKKVVKFNINYDLGVHGDSRISIDDWGYDEFIPADEHSLSHEILFASGATLFIQFKNKMIFISKLSSN